MPNNSKWDQYAEPQPSPSGASKWEQYADPQQQPTQESALSRFGSNFLQQANPIPGIKSLLTHPIDTATNALNAQIGQFKQAVSDLSNTKEMPNLSDRLMSAGGHALAGAIPFIGPAAAQAGEQIGNGDVAGGMGTAAGVLGPLLLGPHVTKGVGKLVKAPAESIAETALGVRKLDRTYGKTPGSAILNETKGVRPATIADSANSKLGSLNSELESKAAASDTPTSLQPALDVLNDAERTAISRNNGIAVQQINPMRAHLTQEIGSGSPIPVTQTPANLLNLKRGFGEQFFHPNPKTLEGTLGTAHQAYHALDSELDRTVPGANTLNQRISSLIPVAKLAESRDLNAGMGQRVLGRFAAHTGALAGAGFGYHAGGPAGALLGLVLPEMAASPTVQMIAARGLHGAGKALGSPAAQRIAQVAPIIKAKPTKPE